MTIKVYVGLGIAAVIALTVSLYLPSETWLGNLGLNLGANIVGILIALLFVKRIVRAQEEENRKRVARGALRKTGQAISQIVRAFSNLLKGSLVAMPSPAPAAVSELFAGELVENLKYCDLGSVQAAPAGRGWAEYMNGALHMSLAEIAAAIDMYGTFLPSEYLELLDELHDHVYVAYVRSMYPYIEHERSRSPESEFPLDARTDDRKDFFRTLVKAVDFHNRIAHQAIKVPASFASDSYAPEVGSLRIKAARAHSEPSVEPPTASEPSSSELPKVPPAPRLMFLDP